MIIPLTDVIGIVGKTGSGKTYAAKSMIESLLSEGARVCIVDPTGVYWGLRRRADGSDGFPVVIFGGEHADVPITDKAGSMLGEIIATGKVHSAIIDVSEFTGGESTRLLTDFFEMLYAKANRYPLHLVLDEADSMAPQSPMPDQRRLQGAVNKVVRRGRVKGFRPIMITQRPAVIDKSVLSQISTLVAMRLPAPHDRKAIDGWVKGNADTAQAKAVLDSLSSMAVGEGWVWSPANDILERKRFPRITTYDSSKAPEYGEVLAEPPALSDIDVGALRDMLAPPEETPAKESSRDEIEATRSASYQDGYADGLVEGTKRGHLSGIAVGLARAMNALNALTVNEAGEEPSAATAPAPPQVAPEPPPASRPMGKVGGERRPLAALVSAYPAGYTEAQWATITGMKRSGGTWNTYKSRLRSARLIVANNGLWYATKDGIEILGSQVEKLPDGGPQRVEMWAGKVGGAGRVLRYLGERYPQWISRVALADALGLAASGGTFNTYLSRLRSNGLIDEAAGSIRCSSSLYN